MPETIDKFQDLKYNKNTQEKFAALEKVFYGYSEYKSQNPNCTPSDYRKVLNLKKHGVEGNIHIPARKADIDGYGYSDRHINNDNKRGISREKAETFIQKAVISIEQGKGRREVFYSIEGVAIIDVKEKRIVTAWGCDKFDKNVQEIMEVVIRNGRG